MGQPKGEKLFVNVSASQARKRLKGFGHGVRKIQSAGKNQAVIIHTATGVHREELQAQFVDVGYSLWLERLGDPIENVRNLGPQSAEWLRGIGIGTLAELRQVGAVAAFARLRQVRPNVSLNLLWAMVGGLSDRDWRDVPEQEKLQLLAEVEED